MVSVGKINLFVFILMIYTFLFSSKLLTVLGLRVVGFEYFACVLFYVALIVINLFTKGFNFHFRRQHLFAFTLLSIFCFINYFFVNVSLPIYFQGTFFSFLFAIHFIIFYNVRFSIGKFFFAAKAIVFAITCIGISAYIERIFVEGDYQSYFLRGVSTIAKDPSFATTLLNVNIVFCLALYQRTRARKYLYLVAFSVLTISLMLFIKAFIVAILICFAYIRFFQRGLLSKLMINTAISIVIAGLIFFGKPLLNEIVYKFNMYFGEGYEKIPRNALYIASFKIATDYFPFGSGQGTFGSYPVGKHYSQIYYDYDLDKVQGLGRDNALGLVESHFIFDTHWSSILGEMGFIAFVIYMFLWLYPAMIAWYYLRSSHQELKLIAFMIFMVMMSVLIESVASPLPGQLQFIHIYAGLGAIGCRLCKEYNTAQEFK